MRAVEHAPIPAGHIDCCNNVEETGFAGGPHNGQSGQRIGAPIGRSRSRS